MFKREGGERERESERERERERHTHTNTHRVIHNELYTPVDSGG